MQWLLEAQARATQSVAAVSPLLLVVLREAHDQPALGEVVPIGPMDLAPLASSLLCQGRLLGAPSSVPTRRWLIAAFCR
jgi:hypothetical protein